MYLSVSQNYGDEEREKFKRHRAVIHDEHPLCAKLIRFPVTLNFA